MLANRVIAGNFGDSMVPLFRYASMFDLRSQNEFVVPELANNNSPIEALP